MGTGVTPGEPKAKGIALRQAIRGLVVGSAKLKQGYIGVLALGVVAHGIQTAEHQARTHHTQILTQGIQDGHDAFGGDAGVLFIGLGARQRVVHDLEQALAHQVVSRFAAKHFGANAVLVGHVRARMAGGKEMALKP